MFVIFSFDVDAQFRDFLNYKYTWDSKVEIPDLDDGFSHENAIALKEENRIAVNGLKSEFMYLYFEQKGMILFQNEKGIQEHSWFLFPKPIDPLYERQFIPIDQPIYAPYFNTKLIFFSGRILRKDGSVEPAVMTYSFPQKRRIVNNEYESVFLYLVQIQNLEPGDVLEYHYKYEVPYDVNWMHFNSTRIFYADDIAKQSYDLRLELHKNQRATILGPEHEVTENKKEKIYSFHFENLPAILEEPGSRIYLEYEPVTIKLNENNLSYTYRHQLSGEILPAPFHIFVLKQRQENDIWYRRVARRKFVFDKQSRLFRKWMDDKTMDYQMQTPLQRLEALHFDISRNFKYVRDDYYYSGIDQGLERIGTNISEKRLRSISRHSIYSRMLNFLGFEKFRVLYLNDIRAGKLSKDYPSNLYFNERIYMTDQENPHFLFPKNSGTGWFLDEVPFYWQDSKALGYTSEELLEDDRLKFKWITIPVDTIKNLRDTKSMVQVNLNTGNVNFETNLRLKGQFSTLTRGVYLNNEIDSTINPNYANKIFELPGRVFLKDEAPVAISAQLPYSTHFRCMYHKQDEVIVDEEYSYVSLNGLCNFVLWDRMDFTHRKSDYYPDFGFNDFFEYEFEFGEPVELISAAGDAFDNEYGSFGYRIEQTTDTTILFVAEWFLTDRTIPAEEIEKLKDFYNAIIKLNDQKIIFRKLKV